ncbi:MAG: hypothetical protein ACKPJJ_26605, partial [Planctomycetaceae bacterium]
MVAANSQPAWLRHLLLLTAILLAGLPHSAAAEDNRSCPVSVRSTAQEMWFATELWAKVGRLKCLRCHRAGGDAAESSFVLLDPSASLNTPPQDALRHNLAAFTAAARLQADGQFLLLQKPLGQLEHGGGAVLQPDSSAVQLLAEFKRRVDQAAVSPQPALPQTADGDHAATSSFFAGVTLADDQELLRRAALSLVGRLPTAAEQQQVQTG